jgi:hypothetical protein
VTSPCAYCLFARLDSVVNRCDVAFYGNISTSLSTHASSISRSVSTKASSTSLVHPPITSAELFCNCNYTLSVSVLKWATLSVTTLNVTKILIVNNQTNATSTSTSYESESLTSTFSFSPLPTNEHGAPITTITILDEMLASSTTVMYVLHSSCFQAELGTFICMYIYLKLIIKSAYPNNVFDYDPSYTIAGPFPTTFPNGSSYCTNTLSESLTSVLPSHPTISIPGMTTPPSNPYLIAAWSPVLMDLSDVFPGVLPTDCYSISGVPGPADQLLTPVFYLTTTSVSYLPKTSDPFLTTASDTYLTTTSTLSNLEPLSLKSLIEQTTAQAVHTDTTTTPLDGSTNAGDSVTDSNPSSSQDPDGASITPLPLIVPVVRIPAAVFTIEDTPITASASAVIASQTLLPGGPPITVSGTPISLAPSASYVVVDSSTIPLSQNSLTTNPPLVLTLGAGTFTANSVSEFLVGDQTLVPGGPGLTVSGTSISLAPGASYVVVGSSTIPLIQDSPITNPPLVVTLGTETLTANSISQFTIAGQTLVPGGPGLTVSGTSISLAPGASYIIVGSSTISLFQNSPITKPPLVVTLGTETFTANSISQIIIAGQTLVPGGPAITVSGTRISLALGATTVAIVSNSDIELESATLTGILTDSMLTTGDRSGATQTRSGISTAINTAGAKRMKSAEVGAAGRVILTVVIMVVVCNVW